MSNTSVCVVLQEFTRINKAYLKGQMGISVIKIDTYKLEIEHVAETWTKSSGAASKDFTKTRNSE